jgi:hypothetical protein
MRAAPSFELTLGLSAIERSALALLVAVSAAAIGAWLWSFADADAGPQGRGPWAWLAVVAAAAGVGGWIGWAVAKPRTCTLRWHQGVWTWVDAQSGTEYQTTVEPRIDLGSWLLLALRLPDGVTRWATVGRRRAGTAWHPLRATLFAPARHSIEPGAGESAPR